MLAIPTTAIDVTAQLAALRPNGVMDQQRLDSILAPLRERITTMTALLVPGFLSDFLKFPDKLRLTDYLKAQETGLRPICRGVDRLDIDTEATVAQNGQAIARAVSASEGPICIVSHSKGGLDTLEFLLRAAPAERQKVSCWVTFQSPFAGTPLADDADELGLLPEVLIDLFGGDRQSLLDLRTDARASYLRDHAPEIAEIVRGIPHLAVAGVADDGADLTSRLDPFLLPAFLHMQRRNIRSDGVVPTDSAVLPFAHYIVQSPLWHNDAVLGGLGGITALPYEERERLTQALVALALQE